MDPARPLVLTDHDHALIGELVEIINQIDDLMIQTVAHLLNLNRAAANIVMGSIRAASKPRDHLTLACVAGHVTDE